MTETNRRIERRVGEALSTTGATVAVAESCTGGLIASLLTDVPGASAYFDRALVAYDRDTYRTLLGVARETLDAHGAVSDVVAREMARAARDLSDTTWGLAATGILGPEGGSAEKPVGTAFVAVAYAGEWGSLASDTAVTHHALDGDRPEVKRRLAERSLEALHEAITARR